MLRKLLERNIYGFYYIYKLKNTYAKNSMISKPLKCSFIWSIFGRSHDKNESLTKYGAYTIKRDVVNMAEELHANGRYLEEYELLNRIQFAGDIDIHWRLSRVLFKLSESEKISLANKNQLISEGYDFINAVINYESANTNPQVHKWMAILLDAKSSMEGIKSKIESADKIKMHLEIASSLNPEDANTMYLIGFWCYQIADLSWLKRVLADVFFCPLPISSYEEAYKYFLKAEQICPRRNILTAYMLGKTSLKLKKFYWAHYYFTIVTEIKSKTKEEKRLQHSAQNILCTIENYDVTNQIINQF